MLTRCSLLLLCFVIFETTATAGELREEIDRHVTAKLGKQPVAAMADDGELLRRVYLDLAGRIPTATEARAYFADSDSAKYEKLVDRLLASADHRRRLRELLHVVLMERRGDNPEWDKFLTDAAEKSRPWDSIVADILNPPADDENRRGAAYFYTSRLVKEGAFAPLEVPQVTRDVGRLFAGVDLQCAQCHDHLTVDDYKQRDFQGLHMIFENLATRRDVKFPAVSEKAMSAPKEYESVFVQVKETTPPVIPGGKVVPIPTLKKEEIWKVAPDRKKRTPGVPRFSPLAELASALPSAKNDLFRGNIANRLWFVMMGEGLVMPMDLSHSENPATHPELLTLLSREFAAHKFEIRWLLKEIALSECYRRTSRIPAGVAAPPAKNAYTVANEKRLSAEQLFWSVLIATGAEAHLKVKPALNQTAVLSPLVEKNQELTELRTRFLKTFANPPKEPEIEFEPSVKAALFMRNSEEVVELLKRKPGNLIDRLSKLTDTGKLAEELFVTVLSRRPSADDVQLVTEVLREHAGQREKAIVHLAWALLSSTEFCVNH